MSCFQMDDCVALKAIRITEDTNIQMLLQPDIDMNLNIQALKNGKITLELNDSSNPAYLMKALATSTLKTTPTVYVQ